MHEKTFQVVLPQIEVGDLGYPVTIFDIARDLREHPGDFILPGIEDFAALIAAGYSVTVERDGSQEIAVLIDATGERVSDEPLADYKTYWATSTNGKRTLTRDSSILDGWFDSIPVELLRPDRGEQILGYDPDR